MKKILFFTGTRADYGLLYPLIRLFKSDASYKTEILATGSHLSERFGRSINEIIADGMEVDWKAEIDVGGDTPADNASSMAKGLQSYAQILTESKPGLAVVLGDRFEALAFAVACQLTSTPLAHLHGGELTEGAVDDAFRHSITKLSYLHFTSAEPYRKRVIQLGEAPERVFNTGALGVDNILNEKLLSREELERKMNFAFRKNNFMVTFHPETLSHSSQGEQTAQILAAVEKLISRFQGDCFFIFTMPNADFGHREIMESVSAFAQKFKDNTVVFKSMGRLNYLSAVANCDVVLGNSSSGVIEAPALHVPTVNVGDRQAGRLRAESVFDVKWNEQEIVSAALEAHAFRQSGKKAKAIFGDGTAAAKMKAVIDRQPFKNEIRKKFYDRD